MLSSTARIVRAVFPRGLSRTSRHSLRGTVLHSRFACTVTSPEEDAYISQKKISDLISKNKEMEIALCKTRSELWSVVNGTNKLTDDEKTKLRESLIAHYQHRIEDIVAKKKADEAKLHGIISKYKSVLLSLKSMEEEIHAAKLELEQSKIDESNLINGNLGKIMDRNSS